jgi:hypothetical protein
MSQTWLFGRVSGVYAPSQQPHLRFTRGGVRLGLVELVVVPLVTLASSAACDLVKKLAARLWPADGEDPRVERPRLRRAAGMWGGGSSASRLHEPRRWIVDLARYDGRRPGAAAARRRLAILVATVAYLEARSPRCFLLELRSRQPAEFAGISGEDPFPGVGGKVAGTFGRDRHIVTTVALRAYLLEWLGLNVDTPLLAGQGTACDSAYRVQEVAGECYVPPPGRPVAACGGQDLAVRAERHPVHAQAAAAGDGDGCADLAAGGDVPQPGRPVAACGGQECAVRAERHPVHAAAAVSVQDCVVGLRVGVEEAFAGQRVTRVDAPGRRGQQ